VGDIFEATLREIASFPKQSLATCLSEQNETESRFQKSNTRLPRVFVPRGAILNANALLFIENLLGINYLLKNFRRIFHRNFYSLET
jgi:hypothetical protein